MGYGSLDPPFKDGSNMQLKRSGTCPHPDFVLIHFGTSTHEGSRKLYESKHVFILVHFRSMVALG